MKHDKPKILFIGPLPPPLSGPELSMQLFLQSTVLNEAFSIVFLKTNFRLDNKKKGKLSILMVKNFFIYFYKLIKILVTSRIACVYYPVTPTQIGWLGRDIFTIWFCKLFNAKVVIHLRGSHFKLNYQNFNRLMKYFVGLSLRLVDKAIVQAHYLKDQFLPYIPKSQVEVLYQGIDVEKYTNDYMDTVEVGKVLVVGHMTKAKGYTDILKIIPDICQKSSYVKFYFAGTMRKGERGVFYNQYNNEKIVYEDPFQAEAEIKTSKFNDNYINLGVITGKEKMRHLNTTDIFLSASYSEGFSRALLEAVSIGKPIVFSSVGAHREVFQDEVHGYTFEPGNLNELKSALQRMISSPDRQTKFGDRNRSYAISNFSIKKISNDFKSIILNTLAS